MKILIIFLLIFTKCCHLQEIVTLFNCTFDDGFNDDCDFNGLLPMNDKLEISDGQVLNTDTLIPPNRPLSDVTSVCKFYTISVQTLNIFCKSIVSPTINGEMCLFPYNLNGWDMNFCLYQTNTNYSQCPTESGNQTCVKGYFHRRKYLHLQRKCFLFCRKNRSIYL